MILLDANIFMYAAGAEHPNKQPSTALLAKVADGSREACIDCETLQEILHRYRAINRWADGRQVYDNACLIVPLILPVTESILDSARDLLDQYEALSARDALHAAVAFTHDIPRICSYDRDFDQIEGLKRVEP
ncbi:MAG TPA: type II toxin-antitoxin system VapC family toxin [Acidobacteriota bacterium]|nr:type II toxin-antitoxin system VapC family toxin [Acidobacteriota bacterium]